jgi:crotonobetainyl-CoA:carnitine CoA-transferase CaiB-like acyl-CoA transferase
LGSSKQALSGIRVVDFTQVIFGPSCTAQLADHGAEVIKIERPGSGDLARQFGPYVDGESMPYASINRNKKSLAINLKDPAGLEAVFKLIESADVVVSNFRQGVMESLGLGWEEVHARSPRVIYASGSGYGPSGPIGSTRKMGHDSMAQAMTGVMAINADSNGVPRRVELPVADISAGNLLMEGILLALIERGRSGVGQKVEVALIDALLWMEAWSVATVANATPESDHLGNPLDGGVYLANDGYLVVTGLFKPNPLQSICEVLEIDDLSALDRFSSVDGMTENAEELTAIIQAEIEKQSRGYWVPKFDDVDVLCMPVLSLDQAITQPQIVHNEMVVDVAAAKGGGVSHRHVGIPVKLGSTPGSIKSGAPKVGEHSNEILADIGYSDDQINGFVGSGVIGIG